MKENLSAFSGAIRCEMLQMGQSKLLIALALIQAITFLLLVSLFALTGSMAPTALINEDHGPMAKIFIADLEKAHHSFALQSMDQKTAQDKLQHGKLVAEIIIPSGFSKTIQYGDTTPVSVEVDNIDADLTDDIERALPSAIVMFGKKRQFPNLQVHVVEADLQKNDTGFMQYLIVSALVLDAFVLAGILSATTVAREFEQGTIKQLFVAPVNPLIPLMGRVLVASLLALCGIGISLGIVIIFYKVVPIHPFEALGALVLCIIVFCCVGCVMGVMLKRVLPVASLIFGLSLPLYIDSGSLEPERFDGNSIWGLAHLSPLYYAIGILEHAFHGYQVTPEPIFIDFLALIGWALLMLFIATSILRKKLVT